MSKKYSILALFTGIVLLLSFSANPPNGHTGGPGEDLCSDCHSLNGGTQNGNISVTGMPASITPNTAYVLTMTSSNPNGVAALAGFQLTILNSNNTIAGTITGPSAGSTVQTSGGRQYWEHNPAQPYPGSNVVTWTATWTSPTMPANTTISYYAAGNIANGNGSSSGDLIVTTTGSGVLMGGGSNLTVVISSSTDVLCFGQSTGSATASASGGTMPYTYVWSNGATGATANNLAAGSYTVTVTDNAAATATASVVIDQPSALVLNTPVINHVTCNGGSNGSITASASGGVSPYFFQWSNGSTGATISNLTAGSYTVTVTDDNNCTKTATYMVTQPAAIVITLVDLNHETCAGEDDGSITISATGGATPLFAEWSNGSIGFTITGLTPDVYSVTVTDNNDCTKTATYTVNAGGTVEVDLVEIHHVTCFGGSNGAIEVNATGGVIPYSYDWSNGVMGPSINGLVAGNYVVTVTDFNGCEIIEFYTITQPPSMNVTISQTSQNLCAGDATADLTASVTGGSSPHNALWSNGVTGLVNSNVVAGSYTVTITDAGACTATSTITVTDPAPLVVSVSTTDETASGANNGTATANAAGGTGAYTYVWSNGQTTQSISNLPPGTYTVTVTDMNGCVTTGSGQVDAFGCNLDVMLGNDVLVCVGDTTLILPVVTGATGSITYVWSNGATTPTLSVSSAGEFCVTVTDQANCQDADCLIITEDTIPDFTCPVINESAQGANDGAIDCAGLPNIVSYLWSNGATTPGITGLPPGQYCVTVTNTNGCIKVQCFNVQPGDCQMTVNATINNIACAGDSTGSIVLSVNGGTAPISFIWSTGATTSTLSNVPAGNWGVTVSDAAGCIVENVYSVVEPAAIDINVDTIIPISDFPSGEIQITVTGGFPPYTYLWTSESGQTFTQEDLSELSEIGYYSVLVTDAANCTASVDSIFLPFEVAVNRVPDFLPLNVYPVPANEVLVVDLENQIVEAFITGIDGRTYKRIMNPVANRLDVSDLEAGWYILRMTDGEKWYIARMVK